MKLMVSNCERHHVFCLLSSGKCCKTIVFLPYFIPLSWDTNNRCEKLQTKRGSVYKPNKKCLWHCISPKPVFGVLRYSAINNLYHVSFKMEIVNVPDRSENISVFTGLRSLMLRYGLVEVTKSAGNWACDL